MPPNDSDCIKNKSHDNIYSQNYYDISNKVIIQKLLSDDLKDPINNFNISSINERVTWKEEILLIDPNRIGYKNYLDNYNKSNSDISNKVGGKRQKLDNLEGFEYLHNINYKQKIFDHI